MEDEMTQTGSSGIEFVELAASIVSAYVANNSLPSAELPTLLSSVHAAIAGLGDASASAEPEQDMPTATQIRKSIKPDGIVSFIDGKSYKTLKRHLTKHGHTPESYRERYGLPRDYPIVAANYSESRATIAKSLGLGRSVARAAAAK
ncbi:MucR family transcriptional regulator [Methylobacterium sp. NEAU K]|uniref:MucR family transcriptional regulator n=1 Tax=Methylobacterium sp. NEAU K TaxID=3064946 RepID=UPI002734E208|nr:MucR family transcriptional regulator [Methylobacterium sp. NEAU K]MDP4006387.1 MucR family transcriptional regulator [Methylobacterium sp. NEAU K]